MNNATTATHYNDLMVGDSIFIPCRNSFYSVAWVGGGVVALELGDHNIWQIHECQDGHFAVADC